MKKIQLGHHQRRKKYKYPIMYALVDDEDYEKLNEYFWHPAYNKSTDSFYARTNKEFKQSMHRKILNAPKGSLVDHINHDTLDNRKENLRIVTESQSSCNRCTPKHNTSGYRGVHKNSEGKKWEASIGYDGKRIYLGLFETPEGAAGAYNKAAQDLHGDFAKLNDVQSRGR